MLLPRRDATVSGELQAHAAGARPRKMAAGNRWRISPDTIRQAPRDLILGERKGTRVAFGGEVPDVDLLNPIEPASTGGT